MINNLTIDAGSDATICEGESAVLHANTNAATIAWSPAATLNDAASKSPIASPTIQTKYYPVFFLI